MKRKVCLISMLFLSACTSKPTQPVANPDPAVVEAQGKEMKASQRDLEQQNFSAARDAYAKFLKKNSPSVYDSAAKLGLAKSYEGLQDCAKATEIYREVIESTRSTQPEITAEALYQAAFCYEALGDETRVLASLLDALKLQNHLKDEVRSAEIPARLAASYKRMGQEKEAQKYLSMAEDGAKKIRAKAALSSDMSPQTREDLSRTYYLMGSFSTNQLSYETVQASLDTLELMQIFLLRSIELESSIYSKKSLAMLKGAYRDIWNIAQNIPLNSALDAGAAEREREEKQIDVAAKLLALMTDLDSYQVPNADRIDMVRDLWAYMSEFRGKLISFISTREESLPLTPEAKRRQSLKREGVVIDEPQFPNEKFIPKSLPQKSPSPPKQEEDPNLKM